MNVAPRISFLAYYFQRNVYIPTCYVSWKIFIHLKILRRAESILLCGKILLESIVKENLCYLQGFLNIYALNIFNKYFLIYLIFYYILIFNIFFDNVSLSFI